MSITKCFFTLLLLCGIVLPSIAQRNLKSYYFQLKEFRQPKVYVMSCPEDPELTRYFHMESHGDTLITKIYDIGGNIGEESYEVFGKKGTQVIKTILFYNDGQDEVLRNVMEYEEGTYVFLWKPEGPFSYTARVELEYDEEDVMSRERAPGLIAKEIVLGKKRKVLQVVDSISVDGPGWDAISFSNQVYYSKKLGIVQIDMLFPEFEHSLYLTEILTESEWIQRIR